MLKSTVDFSILTESPVVSVTMRLKMILFYEALDLLNRNVGMYVV